MKVFRSIKKVLSELPEFICGFIKTNILKTIWFNFRMLPFRQAIHIPIFLYGKTEFRNLSGNIICNFPPTWGKIKIGINLLYVSTTCAKTVWDIQGTIVFNGFMSFLNGSYVIVAKDATLTFGQGYDYPNFYRNMLGSNSKIFCFDSITIDDSHITYDCIISDTSYHYVEDMETGEIKPLTKPVHIGDRVWISNGTIISKGAVIPNNTIVAQNSLINKDYSSIGEYCLLGGQPAKVIKKGIRRIWDREIEEQLDTKFGYNRTHL